MSKSSMPKASNHPSSPWETLDSSCQLCSEHRINIITSKSINNNHTIFDTFYLALVFLSKIIWLTLSHNWEMLRRLYLRSSTSNTSFMELNESQPTFPIPSMLHFVLSPTVLVPPVCSLSLVNKDTLPLICFKHPLSRICLLGIYKTTYQTFRIDHLLNLLSYFESINLADLVPLTTQICLTWTLWWTDTCF